MSILSDGLPLRNPWHWCPACELWHWGPECPTCPIRLADFQAPDPTPCPNPGGECPRDYNQPCQACDQADRDEVRSTLREISRYALELLGEIDCSIQRAWDDLIAEFRGLDGRDQDRTGLAAHYDRLWAEAEASGWYSDLYARADPTHSWRHN